jgi:hypothetical protein
MAWEDIVDETNGSERILEKKELSLCDQCKGCNKVAARVRLPHAWHMGKCGICSPVSTDSFEFECAPCVPKAAGAAWRPRPMGTAVPEIIEDWLAGPSKALESQASKLEVFQESRPPAPNGWTDDAISVDVLATAPFTPGAESILRKISEAVGETCPAGIKTGEATAEAMASMLNSLEEAARLGTELAKLCGSWKGTIQNYRKFHLQG